MSDEHNDIHAVLDELGAPRGSTTAMRIRGLHRVLVQERDAALAALSAAEDALTDAAVTDGETLSDRIRDLATRAAKYHGALVGANGERDETLRYLREENERLAAQLEFAERVLIAGIRRATP